MAYVKTAWVDRNPPRISAAQLNRMEQGIADANDLVAAPTIPPAWQVINPAGQAAPAFQNGWANFDAQRVGRFYKHNGRTYLEGIVASGPIGSAIFTLPVGYRPVVGAE